MDLSQQFWRGKRVLLTGHTGFKGSWLALWLRSMGAEVTGFALDPGTEPSLFELAGVAEGINDQRGDLRDLGALLELIAENRPEIVLHLAAQPLVREGYRDPLALVKALPALIPVKTVLLDSGKIRIEPR